MSSAGSLPRDVLARGLAELGGGAPVLESVLDRLVQLAELLASWNRRINLTAHRTPEAIARRLILDALAIAGALPPFEDLVDLGAGAGMPGLPIAIHHRERRVTLVEARERRHHFQRAAVRELGLENVNLIRGRAEQLEPSEHTVVIAQAMADPSTALGWMVPWARRGGLLVIPGGPAPPAPAPHPRLLDCRVIRYRVPVGGPARTLWVGIRGGS